MSLRSEPKFRIGGCEDGMEGHKGTSLGGSSVPCTTTTTALLRQHRTAPHTQHSTSTAQHATAASVLDFHQQLEVRSAKCNMRKACCSVVGSATSALPFLRQNPSNQHPAPSSNLVLASPGTVEMNKSNLQRTVTCHLDFSTAPPSPSLAAMCKPE
jgi:hypothetical protein